MADTIDELMLGLGKAIGAKRQPIPDDFKELRRDPLTGSLKELSQMDQALDYLADLNFQLEQESGVVKDHIKDSFRALAKSLSDSTDKTITPLLKSLGDLLVPDADAEEPKKKSKKRELTNKELAERPLDTKKYGLRSLPLELDALEPSPIVMAPTRDNSTWVTGSQPEQVPTGKYGKRTRGQAVLQQRLEAEGLFKELGDNDSAVPEGFSLDQLETAAARNIAEESISPTTRGGVYSKTEGLEPEEDEVDLSKYIKTEDPEVFLKKRPYESWSDGPRVFKEDITKNRRLPKSEWAVEPIVGVENASENAALQLPPNKYKALGDMMDQGPADVAANKPSKGFSLVADAEAEEPDPYEEGFDPFTPQQGVIQPPNIDVGTQDSESPDYFKNGFDTISFKDYPDGNEILVPGVDKEGNPISEDDAIEQYRQTGKHLGMFSSPQDADIFAKQLDQFQGGQEGKYPRMDEEDFTDSGVEAGPQSMRSLDESTVHDFDSDLSNLQPADANEEIGNIVEETPPEKRVYGKLEKLPKKMEGPPTIQNYLQYATDNALNNAAAASSRFPEESDPGLTQAIKSADPMQQQIKNIGKLPPEERANTGALIGAKIGATYMGRAGATIGGRIGAFAGRGAGVARSGELAQQNRDNRIWGSLMSMGAVKPDGKVKFEDTTVQLPDNATGRLKNLTANPLNGNRDRSLYELDTTNPLTQRASMVAKPLAMYYAQAMLGYKNKDSKVDAEAPKSAAAMLANTFTQDAKSEAEVYSRAQQMAKKMGVSEKAMKSYFSTVSADLPITEAESIKKALDIIYAK